jgi:prepilin-type N-terminal cleavage/methylation domain-containing protein
MQNIPVRRGFTLIELMLTIAIIGLLASVILIGQRSASSTRRDVKRYADVKSFEQALSLYLAKTQTYPVYVGCVSGINDPVTNGLRAQAIIAANVALTDPSFPNDPAKCYFYTGTASTYTLRYTIELNSGAGSAGNHLLVP